MLPAKMIMDWTLYGTASQPQLNVYLYKNCFGHGISSQQWNPKTVGFGGLKTNVEKFIER